MEYYLVKYVEDGILQVVSKVLRKKRSVKAKYLDGRYYDAEIIAGNCSRSLLEEILWNLNRGLPVVFLKRENFVDVISPRCVDRGE